MMKQKNYFLYGVITSATLALLMVIAVLWLRFTGSLSLYNLSMGMTFFIVMFMLVVILQYSEGYSFIKLKWIYLVGLPSAAVLCCVVLLIVFKAHLNTDFISSGSEAVDAHKSTYADLVVSHGAHLKQFSALILIIISEVWCFLAFLNYLSKQGSSAAWQTVDEATGWFAKSIGLTILFLATSFVLVFT
jgi:hypothetical protein